MNLSDEELRVAGSLAEKQLTTPQQYPLTLNALVSACNQTSNRSPVVAYDERAVESVVAGLKEQRLVRFVFPSHGRSATRYRQVMEEVLGLDARQLALLAVLMLRGPQTLGELKTRTERMAPFADLADVERELQALAGRDDPLVVQLARQPGQKEARYAHLLAGEPANGSQATWTAERATDEVGRRPVPRPRPEPGDAGPSLADDVVALREEVASLRRDLDDVRAQLGL